MNKNGEQIKLFEEEQKREGPVTCLGLTFPSDEKRREHFRKELRQKLVELRGMEGFPLGEEEAIIALSDPPYYTACPNPWLNEAVQEWETEKEKWQADKRNEYHREPYAADISEGKNDAIYNAHSYHTKVPYKAIMRYILHYTEPGDIVLDGFSGTGMTGIGAKMCASKSVVEELGYKVENGEIKAGETVFSKLGFRKSIVNDLAPIASFISSNYNHPTSPEAFRRNMEASLGKVEENFGWMYETEHTDGSTGRINYTVWSDVFACPECSKELVFWDVAVEDGVTVKDTFHCPGCSSSLTKRSLEKKFVTYFDDIIQQPVQIVKQVPVFINYTAGGKRFEKSPDEKDLVAIEKINSMDISAMAVPVSEIEKGEKTHELIRNGITHAHLFYTKRNLIALAAVFDSLITNHEKFLFTATIVNLGKTARYKFKRSGNVPLSGTIYLSSLMAETNVFHALRGKIGQIEKMLVAVPEEKTTMVSNGSATNLPVKDNAIDYIFTDPPFGANLIYSDLNFITESWLQVKTNVQNEAIVDKVKNKNITIYQSLMEKSFREYYRVLKPGRWMTVEFSNSQASVWNSIQEAIQRSGFIIANVAALDKKQGSFNAVMSTTAVKQDLVISVYKPSTDMLRDLSENKGTVDSCWIFVKNHLEKLPVFLGAKGEAKPIIERTPRVLFDRMVAYHVQNGLAVPLSSPEFQREVVNRFAMRDGMVFLEEQVVEYDKRRILIKEFSQMSLFVSDETSAIEWLRQQLMKKPQTRQDLHPNFMKEIQHIPKHEVLPELDDLLEQNFLKYEGKEEVPSQIQKYLSVASKDLRGLLADDPKLKEKGRNRWYVPDPNKQADLEKLREKALLKEFDSYLQEMEGTKKRLKQFRTEAIRIGFKRAWGEKDFDTIVKLGERLPEKVLQEDEKLLMYFDNAQIYLGM
ncbi:MAG: DNA methylase [Bacillus sp. (in: Bacteria)]|nr:DNA methylase [Bacillus sp. (in: firmicutes)]